MRRIGMTMLFALAAACASAPAPTDRVASSQASIRAAEEMGAHNVPTAALHLQLANEELDQSRQLIRAGRNDRARTLLMRAEADAELALTLARESSMRAQAQQAMEHVHALQ